MGRYVQGNWSSQPMAVAGLQGFQAKDQNSPTMQLRLTSIVRASSREEPLWNSWLFHVSCIWEVGGERKLLLSEE